MKDKIEEAAGGGVGGASSNIVADLKLWRRELQSQLNNSSDFKDVETKDVKICRQCLDHLNTGHPEKHLILNTTNPCSALHLIIKQFFYRLIDLLNSIVMFIFYTALIIVLLIMLLVFLAVLHYILPNFSAMAIGTIKLVVQSLENFTYLLLSMRFRAILELLPKDGDGNLNMGVLNVKNYSA